MAQRRIGRYRVLDQIAAGGQAVVYRAWDTETGAVLALKVLHSHFASDAAYLERFRREAHITASINHPNVIRIFEVAQDGDSYFISMEFLPESLSNVMEAEGRLSPERAVNIVYQVCLGLQAAYDAGVQVHRDIKPQNILLAPDGTMKLTDFGIARAADLSAMTRTGQFMGTPHYMSPEQARGERADIRTDIYAFGVVLYQMFTGELPFSADTPLAVLRQHIEVTPPSVRLARADLSPALASVVERCMAKEAARALPDAPGACPRARSGAALARSLQRPPAAPNSHDGHGITVDCSGHYLGADSTDYGNAKRPQVLHQVRRRAEAGA